VPKRFTARPGERRRGDRRQEHEIDDAERHGVDAEGRLHQDEVHVGKGADEGEQDAEADGEARAQGRVLQMHDPGGEVGAHAVGGGPHRRGLLHGEIDEQGAEQVEGGKEVEIGGEPEMVGDTGRDQPPDQIARHVAGDVGGEG
jgi:hypothetical protein